MNPQTMPTLLQSKTVSASTTGSTVSIPLTNPVSTGSFIVIGFMSTDTSGNPPTFTDTLGNNFTPIQILGPETNSQIPNVYYGMYYTNNPTLAGTDTITANIAVSGYNYSFIVFEFSGMPPNVTRPSVISGNYLFDSTSAGNGTQLDSTTTGVSCLQGLNLLIGMAINDGAQTMTVANNYNDTINVTNGTYTLAMNWRAQNIISVIDSSFTIPTAANWVCTITDFNVLNTMNLVPGNTKAATSTTTSVSAIYGTPTTSGNLLLASVYSNAGTNAILGWTQLADQVVTGTQHVTQYYKISDGTETSITATSAGSTIMNLHIYEISNASNPLLTDGIVSNASAGSTFSQNSPNSPSTNLLNLFFGSAGFSSNSTVISSGGTGQLQMFQTLSTPRLSDSLSFMSKLITGHWTIAVTASTNIGLLMSTVQAAPPKPDDTGGGIGSTGVGS
jgi:hypothetical protein